MIQSAVDILQMHDNEDTFDVVGFISTELKGLVGVAGSEGSKNIQLQMIHGSLANYLLEWKFEVEGSDKREKAFE